MAFFLLFKFSYLKPNFHFIKVTREGEGVGGEGSQLVLDAGAGSGEDWRDV